MSREEGEECFRPEDYLRFKGRGPGTAILDKKARSIRIVIGIIAEGRARDTGLSRRVELGRNYL